MEHTAEGIASNSQTDAEQQYQQALNKAYEYLSRREHSRFELANKIRKIGGDAICEQVLDALAQKKAQSDQRFAEMLCRSRFNNGKGPAVIQYELQQHRIDHEIIVLAVSVYDDKWRASAEKVRQQKFGIDPATSFKQWAKQARFLQQRGFTEAEIGSYHGA